MAARKIAAQIEGEGRAVVPPPAEGAVPGVLNGFGKKAFPDRTAHGHEDQSLSELG
jgi:hypothetical protein